MNTYRRERGSQRRNGILRVGNLSALDRTKRQHDSRWLTVMADQLESFGHCHNIEDSWSGWDQDEVGALRRLIRNVLGEGRGIDNGKIAARISCRLQNVVEA
jgi:hypothetical protein